MGFVLFKIVVKGMIGYVVFSTLIAMALIVIDFIKYPTHLLYIPVIMLLGALIYGTGHIICRQLRLFD